MTIAPTTPRARLIRAIGDLEHVHDEEVVDRIERLKIEHGASDQLIADAIGVHPNTIVKWRSGQAIHHPRLVGLALLLLEHVARNDRTTRVD